MKTNINDLELRLVEIGKKQGWWDSKGIVAAVSGGGDSMAMLCLLMRFFRGKLVVAHLDHDIRRGSSQQDAFFVREFCNKNGITVYIERENVPDKKLSGESLEMAGRRIRYSFLERIRTQEGCAHVATGHTADDVVETSLMNLSRGTGLRGLIGIRGVRGNIIRPVISFRRQELRRILIEYKMNWREDETNNDTIYTRNRIRHELLPWLREQLNPNMDAQLLNLSEIAQSVSEKQEGKIDDLLRWLSRAPDVSLWCWDTALSRTLTEEDLTEALRVQGRNLQLPSLDKSRTRQLCHLIRHSNRWRFQWSGTIEVCGCNKKIAWMDRGDFIPPPKQQIPIPLLKGTQTVEWGRWSIEMVVKKGNISYFGDLSAKIPWDGKSPLEISSVLEYIKIHQKETDGTQVPWWARAQWPVFSFQNQTHWTPMGWKNFPEECEYVIIVRSSVRSFNPRGVCVGGL